MYTDFEMNNDSKGVAIVAGHLTDFKTEEDYSGTDSILRVLMPGFINLDFSTVKQKIIEYMVQRDKKMHVFKTPDGNKYPLEQILLSLEEQKD